LARCSFSPNFREFGHIARVNRRRVRYQGEAVGIQDHSMHDDSSNTGTSQKAAESVAAMGVPQKLLLLLFNGISLLQVTAIGTLIWLLRHEPWICLAAVLGVLYLLSPLLARLVTWVLPIRRQVIPIGSRDFFVWWFVLNLQMLFCRFPVLEEVLRVIPGCYSMWLRLWGAKVGRLTYWAAGVRILDRQALDIGHDVAFGAGVRLNPHVMLPDEQGQLSLVLAPVKIGDRVTVGGYSLLVAGTEIAADQCTRAFLILPPFNRLEDGRRIKPDHPATSLEGEDTTPA
jgi:hypothetical protein